MGQDDAGTDFRPGLKMPALAASAQVEGVDTTILTAREDSA
jgi:hypothetical protein